jgi:dihydrofolate synthase/folylpolyglutamate synthase
VSPCNPRAISAQRLAEIAQQYCNEVIAIGNVREGVEYARQVAQEDDLILVTGSLFTVGEARDYLVHREQR